MELKTYKRRKLKDLDSDTLFAIFVKLPIKYLLRLTSVSKAYNQMIRSPEFKKFHHDKISMKDDHEYLLVRNRIKGKERGFSFYSASTFRYDENSGLPRYIDIPMRCVGMSLRRIGFAVYGSCNGLLCISLKNPGVEDPIFLYNPSLRKFKELPKSDFKLPKDIIDHKVILGLGYHSGEDDYQGVRFVHCRRSIFHVEVYSLKLNSWTALENVVDPRTEAGAWFMPGCACLDGVIYWLLMQSHAMSLVSFNMNTKILQSRTLPRNLHPVMNPICLQVLHPECLRALTTDAQVSEKSLCLFQVKGVYPYPQYCDIWDLKGNAEEMIYRMPLRPHASIAWPLGFSANANVAYMVMTISQDYPLLVRYACLDRVQTRLTDISKTDWFVDAYKESLVLLNEI